VAVLDSISNFQTLSLKDLLEAREHYHLHLLNKKNVVGTAVGLYLIRKTDPWPDEKNPDLDQKINPEGERTLENSESRPYSWPCILVFVDKWVDEENFAENFRANDIVPKRLYLPDGRIIPVCVVRVSPVEAQQKHTVGINWPNTRVGGGFPLFSRSQEQEMLGSVGCLVTDGHTTYALTSRHVVGKPGSIVYSRLRGQRSRVGVASNLTLTRQAFNDIYPYLPRSRSYTTIDVGLVEVDDLRDWTTRAFGLPEIGALADINEMNLGTRLIDQPVCAYGATSGRLNGTVKALFYRFQSISGYDYISDLLIAPHDGKGQTYPGDSGTIWHLVLKRNKLDKKPTFHPLAIEWGGQGLAFSDGTRNFALASILSNVLHELNVQLVVDHNAGVRPFWGATGHYSIAQYAIGLVKSPKLIKLLIANAERISFNRAELESGDINQQLNVNKFVPLADVPDIIWKKAVSKVIGGRDAGSQKPEHPTHYADIDARGANGSPSLLELCLADKKNVDVAVWQAFYDSIGETKQATRGLLPFRIWQFFNAMKKYVSNKNYVEFVTAAGILAHYIGDACQPLHGSVLSDGYKDQAEEVPTNTGGTKIAWPAKGVHSAYENKMIDDYTTNLFDEIERQIGASVTFSPIQSGHDAAVAVIALMAEAQSLVPPGKLCDKYIELGSGTSKATIHGLWQAFGKETAKTMYNGAALLALVWDAAWNAGSGENTAIDKLGPIPELALQKLYQDENFLPSLDLDHIAAIL